jgi:hypothetical protein
VEQIRMTLTVPDGTKAYLEEAAEEVNRSKANLVSLLVQDYLASRRPHPEGDAQ